VFTLKPKRLKTKIQRITKNHIVVRVDKMATSQKKRISGVKGKSRKSQLKFQKRMDENNRILKSLQEK